MSDPEADGEEMHQTVSDSIAGFGVPGLAATAALLEDQLRSEFKATDATIDTYGDGATLRLSFQGFTSVEAATERTAEVALELYDYPDVTSVQYGVDSDGQPDRNAEDPDERPAGWVRADVDAVEERGSA